MTAQQDELDIATLPGEQWRDVVGYEGLYLVSTLGRVWSVRRRRINGGTVGGVILREQIGRDRGVVAIARWVTPEADERPGGVRPQLSRQVWADEAVDPGEHHAHALHGLERRPALGVAALDDAPGTCRRLDMQIVSADS